MHCRVTVCRRLEHYAGEYGTLNFAAQALQISKKLSDRRDGKRPAPDHLLA